MAVNIFLKKYDPISVKKCVPFLSRKTGYGILPPLKSRKNQTAVLCMALTAVPGNSGRVRYGVHNADRFLTESIPQHTDIILI